MARYENGWIKVHRRAVIEDIGDNVICLGLWVTFLALATWKESKIMWQGEQRVLPPGSVVYGISEFSERWGVSKNTVRRWVQYLVSTDRIQNESGTHGSIATICNWEKYQTQENEPEQYRNEIGTPTEREVNARSTPSDPYEEGKKVRREEDKSDPKFFLSRENLDRAFGVWLESLKTMKAGRANLLPPEERHITAAIQRYGVNAVVMALQGVPRAPKTDFDSSWFLDVGRVLNSKNFMRFMNLGVQAFHKEQSA